MGRLAEQQLLAAAAMQHQAPVGPDMGAMSPAFQPMQFFPTWVMQGLAVTQPQPLIFFQGIPTGPMAPAGLPAAMPQAMSAQQRMTIETDMAATVAATAPSPSGTMGRETAAAETQEGPVVQEQHLRVNGQVHPEPSTEVAAGAERERIGEPPEPKVAKLWRAFEGAMAGVLCFGLLRWIAGLTVPMAMSWYAREHSGAVAAGSLVAHLQAFAGSSFFGKVCMVFASAGAILSVFVRRLYRCACPLYRCVRPLCHKLARRRPVQSAAFGGLLEHLRS